MRDSYGREIDYLRVSVTDRCNLRCSYCMGEEGVSTLSHSQILRNEEFLQIISEAANLGIKKIRITGGEPLIRKGIVDLMRSITRIKGISELTLTTNGILLSKYVTELKEAGLNRVNVSLDTLNSDRYRKITRGGDLASVLKGIGLASVVGLQPIKINTVLIGGFNEDEIKHFVELTRNDPIDVRFIELMPIGEASGWSKERFVSVETVLQKVPQLYPVDLQERSAPARYYQLPGGIGRVGLISPISCKFCDSCNRLRLTAEGILKPCLHTNTEIDIKHFLNEGSEEIRKCIERTILGKTFSHHLESPDFQEIVRGMSRIGG